MKKDLFDELVVVKRSGQRVNFNNYKIAVAIKNAFDEVYNVYDEKNINKVYEGVLKYIETTYDGRKTINVEDIQDIIENKLKECKFLDVYEQYNNYRQRRAISRKAFTIKAQHKFIKAMEKIANDGYLKNENGLTPNEILYNCGKTVTKEFTKSYIIDSKFLRAHEEGNIYINDLENFPLGIIRAVHPKLKSYLDKTNSINYLSNEITNLQNEVDYAINIPGIDYLLERWLIRQYRYYYKEFIINYTKIQGFDKYLNIKKIRELIDRETEIVDKIYDFMAFIYNDQVERIFKIAYEDTINKITEVLAWKINKLITSLETVNAKMSISFGTNETFAGTLINHALLDVLEGFPPINSPDIIFKVKKNTYEKYFERVTDLVCNGKTISIVFVDNSYNKAENEVEYFADGIRIFDNIHHEKSSYGRMLISETSINICRLALKNKNQPIKVFYKEIDETLDLIKNELLLGFEMIGNKTHENYDYLFNNNVLDDEKLESSGKIRKVIKNGNLNIGVIGLKECIMLLATDDEKQMSLIINILNYLNNKCREFTNETKINFTLCEPCSKKARKELMALDKAIYGEIKNITNKSYYELISDLPIVKDNFKYQAQIQKLFNGGSMMKISLPKNVTNRKLSNIFNDLIIADIGFVRFDHREDVKNV